MKIPIDFDWLRSISDALLQGAAFETSQFTVFKCHVLTLSHFKWRFKISCSYILLFTEHFCVFELFCLTRKISGRRAFLYGEKNQMCFISNQPWIIPLPSVWRQNNNKKINYSQSSTPEGTIKKNWKKLSKRECGLQWQGEFFSWRETQAWSWESLSAAGEMLGLVTASHGRCQQCWGTIINTLRAQFKITLVITAWKLSLGHQASKLYCPKREVPTPNHLTFCLYLVPLLWAAAHLTLLMQGSNFSFFLQNHCCNKSGRIFGLTG